VQFLFADHPLDTDRRELRRGSEAVAVELLFLDGTFRTRAKLTAACAKILTEVAATRESATAATYFRELC